MIYGIKENKSFENVIFTYVVDSDESLAAWVNNEAGNDYSCVLIKKGEWTNENGVNLTTCGTKVVIGEVGSKLVFSSGSGLFYDELPDDAFHFMQNVFVEINSSVVDDDTFSFYQCVNLTNCYGIVDSANGAGRAFCNCRNLINCYGEGYGLNGGSGFYNCHSLTNCYGIAITEAESNQCGFMGCYNLVNCRGEGYQRGFSGCSTMYGCRGYGANGYGFYSCTAISWCRALKTSKTATFDTSNCSASVGSYNASYTVANTPEGGFNNLL